ncbi:hypothetical protein [Bosea sp. (in: a-proteobacteria)]|jgi:invasion protein IalB|uniref:hypothetical protein n=1 Tax=Bosea sp. (in: a-proteobacteria) TaxID=1871050 RepID=UPI002DDDB807|nr:hypothetical protein [Bosea sp. (in: a-proteobacteria)]HEV2512622.1 hypothetical protein [Bosea sp. (in: a-proteobacteria)]
MIFLLVRSAFIGIRGERVILGVGLLVLAATSALAQQPRTVLESPAIDHEAFREGEVTRSRTIFGNWVSVCDEVKRFRQRFCSLRSRAFDQLNRPIADIVISTADNGRPAALITTGLGMVATEPLVIATIVPAQPTRTDRKGGRGRPRGEMLETTRLAARLCIAAGCQMFWLLTSNDIMALREGRDIHFSYTAAPPPGIFPYPYRYQLRTVTLQAAFRAAGFKEAVEASLQ